MSKNSSVATEKPGTGVPPNGAGELLITRTDFDCHRHACMYGTAFLYLP